MYARIRMFSRGKKSHTKRNKKPKAPKTHKSGQGAQRTERTERTERGHRERFLHDRGSAFFTACRPTGRVRGGAFSPPRARERFLHVHAPSWPRRGHRAPVRGTVLDAFFMIHAPSWPRRGHSETRGSAGSSVRAARSAAHGSAFSTACRPLSSRPVAQRGGSGGGV